MKIIKFLIDIFLHLDKNLTMVIDKFGNWSYVILFLVIFLETGLVVTPFLPGDSVLFAAGALASIKAFNIIILYVTLVAAAVLGDTVNYWIGRFIGPKAFQSKSKLLKKEYLIKAQAFYEKHGGKAIILSRFVPIIRTFAPFVAGIGTMNYTKFLSFNIIGGISWVTLFLFGGYFLGNIPIIKNNFEFMIVIIILVSVVPIAIEYFKNKSEAKSNTPNEQI